MRLNAFIDSNIYEFPSQLEIREVINSGYSVWKWTYSGEESYVGMLYGFSGLTMNNVGGMAGSVRRIIAPETITDEEISTNKFHSVTAEYYGFQNQNVSAEFIQISEDKGVFKYTYESPSYLSTIYYSAPVTIIKTENPEDNESGEDSTENGNNDNTGSSDTDSSADTGNKNQLGLYIGLGVGGAVVLTGAVLTVIFIKRRKKL